MSIAAMIPGTEAWLLERIDLQVQFELRKVLRAAVHTFDALFIATWIARPGQQQLLEFAGNRDAEPVPLPETKSSVPSRCVVRDADSESYDAVVHVARLGRGVPRIGIVVVSPGDIPQPAVFDEAERLAERIEATIVPTLVRDSR